MLPEAEQAKAGLIVKTVARVQQKHPPKLAAQVGTFVTLYYEQVAPDDLIERSADDLYGAALAHWHFARHFMPGEAKLKVYNPSVEEHGWQSTHTVIEIVNDDMPFLVDSIGMEVNRQGYTLHLIIHPVMKVERDTAGEMLKVEAPTVAAGARHESIIHVEVDRQTEPEALDALRAGMLRVLADVRRAVEDWRKMLARLHALVAEIKQSPPPLVPQDLGESVAFLEWLAAEHFTFLGFREYDLISRDEEDALAIVPGSGLGILRETGERDLSLSFAALTPEARALARVKDLLVIAKANSRATVHRPGYLDYIGIKRFDARGEVIGERRFLGLYTSTAYEASPTDVPLLRRKVGDVISRAGFIPKSHRAKALTAILEQYPREELIQISEHELYDHAIGILRLAERQRIRLFLRRDLYGRFVTCLIYVPRENYNTELRSRIQKMLMEAFHGTSSEFTVKLSESPLARILIIIRTKTGSALVADARELERKIVDLVRRWQDELHQALLDKVGEEAANGLARRYRAFSAAYREDHSARNAVADIQIMESLPDNRNLGMSLYRPPEAGAGTLRFKVFQSGKPLPLSTSLPMLERMGLTVLDERPYEIEREGAPPVWIHDFGMTCPAQGELEVGRIKDRFEEAFAGVARGETENDDFNRLVLHAGLNWREVVILRAYSRYLRQTGFTFSQAYMEQTLTAHPQIAQQLVALFRARFDPAAHSNQDAAKFAAGIEAAFDAVSVLDEDRILRRFLAVIQATIRTNFFQKEKEGNPKPYVSFKLDSARVPGLPQPLPRFEIFVYSPRVEGIHLRGAKVARGGLRWSDRMEDFRTEVLGLMKAQMVKNAVIVPVGAKGGFVVKLPPAGGEREDILKEGIACYRTFLRGLLDITDNLIAGRIVPPPDVVRHDDDDPYLVVAADKGTASFSDIANAMAAEYRFWLDDAFASGGSVGYDHKKMGITARGAWESVKRHFRELGIDTQTTDFTVAGIGDMSGDVFGNGMLLSPHIKLVAAFDHRHIFLDPEPDPQTSFAERERLFNLPRSSWADYDKKLISVGGGVFARSAKSIALSAQAKRLLGTEAEALAPTAEALTPGDLIRAILKASVDLLYNGGIGTYVKAGDESHVDVGDRANDAIRVDGRELKCRVVAEGGNLGFTQRGRIEYARAGGRINTDAIDNSAGVDCSDHEVNIKILLNSAVAGGELTGIQRNQLLAEMTGEVAQLVLRDNYFQTQSISVSGQRGAGLLSAQTRFMRALERAGKLNRQVEFLPSDEEIEARNAAGEGLTRPERAVLLAYSKIALFEQFVNSDLPEDPYIATALERYFPSQLHSFRERMSRHPLKREIVATHVTNSMINRVGSTFVHRMGEQTGAKPAQIVRAYLLTREIFEFVSLWKNIEALDNIIAEDVQASVLVQAENLIRRGTLWFLRRAQAAGPALDLSATIAYFAPGAATLRRRLAELLPRADAEGFEQGAARLEASAVPATLASRVAGLDSLYSALDMVEIANEMERDIETVAVVYFSLGGRLGLSWLRRQIGELVAETHWQTLAKSALLDDVSSVQRSLAAEALHSHRDLLHPQAVVEAWAARNRGALERCQQVLADLQAAPGADLSMLSVALRELRHLAHSGRAS